MVFCDQNPVFWDHKPACRNNTAIGYEPQVGEIKAHSRQRIAVSTSLCPGPTGDRDEWRTPLEIMLKAAPRGRVGSYRASDMKEYLEKFLKPAGEDYKSHVICLDWHASHMDPSVAELIESRGHVLLLHGGGTTACLQCNDTDMHQHFKKAVRATEL